MADEVRSFYVGEEELDMEKHFANLTDMFSDATFIYGTDQAHGVTFKFGGFFGGFSVLPCTMHMGSSVHNPCQLKEGICYQETQNARQMPAKFKGD